MAEVGVLNLTIKDNSEQAGKGLDILASALSAVKTAVEGFNLSPVGKQVSSLVKKIDKTQSATIKNLSGLFNAISNFSKIKSFNIDTEPFEKLREAVGEGFKIGNAGSQLKQLQEAMTSDWGDGSGMTALRDLRDLTESISGGTSGMKAMADALKDIANSYKQIGTSSAAAGDWRTAMGMSAGTSIGKNATDDVTSGIESGRQEATQAAAEIAYAIINALKDVLEIHSPSRVMRTLGENAAQGFNEGFITISSQAQTVAKDTAENIVNAFNMLRIMQSSNPVDVIASSMRGINETSDAYKSIMSGTLPKVQAISSEEMVMAGHAKLAKAEIESLISTLEKPIGYKGLSEFIDVKTGVKGSMQGGGMINENTTMFANMSAQRDALEQVETAANAAAESQAKVNEAGELYAGVITIFDEAEGHWRQIYIDTSKAAESTERATEATREGISLLTVPASGMNGVFANASEEMNWLTEQIEKAKTSMDQFADIASKAEKQLKYGGPRSKEDLSFDLKHATEGFYEAMNAEEQYKAALQTLMTYVAAYADVARNAISTTSGASIAGEVAQAGETGFLTAAADADTFADSTEAAEFKVSAMVQILWDLGNAVSETQEDFRNLDDRMKAMFPTLTGMIKRFTSMAKMRALRYVIRAIAKGFSEGVQNVYWYSKAVGTDLAPSMDAAATAMLQFKNSIGAAVAPLIQAFVPVLQTVISWLITGINYLNQFFSLLNGQSTWTKAVEYQTTAYEDNTKKAKESAKAAKDLLADWDELNIIQSEGSSGGTGSTGNDVKDYSKMFEQVSSYDSWLKNLVSGIEEEFGSIWNLAKKVGLAILGWKVSSAFSGILGAIGGLVGTALTLDLVFKITSLFDKKWLETGEVGWLISSALIPLLGGVLVKKILGNVLGGKFAKLAIPLSLLFSATADVVTNIGATDVSAISKESLGLSAKTALEVGGAAAYLAKTMMGHTLGGSLAGGAAIAVATFGVAVGIKAVARAIKGADTIETIKSMALSSLAIGLGVGWFAKLAGASLAGALGLGAVAAGATILTLSAAIGIAALITLAQGEDPIKWGNKSLTEAQVQAYVTANGFTLNVPAAIKVIQDTIDTTGVKKSDIESQLITTLGDFEIIKLGVAKDNDYAQLRKDILGDAESGATGLIDKLSEFIGEAKEAGKLTLQFTPTLLGDGETDASKWFESYVTGWDTVDKYAKDTGERIGKLLTKAEQGALEDGEPELMATLMKQMNDLTEAATRGKINSEAFGNLQFNLGDLNQASFDDIVTRFTEYRNELKKQYTAWINEQFSLQGQLVEALLVLDPNQKQQATRDAVAAYEEMSRNMVNAANKEVEKAAEPGVKWLTNFLVGKYKPVLDKMDALFKSFSEDGSFGAFFDDMFTLQDAETAEEAIDQLKTLMMNQLYGFNEDLYNYVDQLELNPFAFVTNDMKEAIEEYVRSIYDPDMADKVLEKIFPVTKEIAEKTAESFPDVKAENEVELTSTVNQTIETTGDTVGDSVTEAVQATNEMEGLTEATTEAVTKVNNADFTIDTTGMVNAAESAAYAFEDMARRIKEAFASLDGLAYSMDVNGAMYEGSMKVLIPVQKKASGGFVRSGDLVMANENGNFEMMGRMGSQPVVANNQQIINGISNGVAQANGGVESRLSAIENLLIRLMNKELVAKVVPSSTMGRSNQMSADAYDRVRG